MKKAVFIISALIMCLFGLLLLTSFTGEGKATDISQLMVPGPPARALLKTANPKASTEAKKILNYLAGLPDRPDNRVIIGQYIGHSPRFDSMVKALHDATGKWPAMIGGAGHTWSREGLASGNKVFIDYWNSGGLIKLGRHADRFGRYEITDKFKGIDLAQLITPGTSANEDWMADLDRIAESLAQLRDAGVVVLWTPFHEMNQRGSRWWSGRDQKQFVDLWKHMFDYFTNTKGLNNLLWVYGPSSTKGNRHRPVDYYYPDDDYVDITALSVYNDVVEVGGYEKLIALGKPFGFSEFGPRTGAKFGWDGAWDNMTLIESIRRRYPKTTFVLYWSSWPGAKVAIVDNQNASDLLNDPWIITREELTWRNADEKATR